MQTLTHSGSLDRNYEKYPLGSPERLALERKWTVDAAIDNLLATVVSDGASEYLKKLPEDENTEARQQVVAASVPAQTEAISVADEASAYLRTVSEREVAEARQKVSEAAVPQANNNIADTEPSNPQADHIASIYDEIDRIRQDA